jgi:hypothetical protein
MAPAVLDYPQAESYSQLGLGHLNAAGEVPKDGRGQVQTRFTSQASGGLTGRCAVLSVRLVQMIEDHANELTKELVASLQSHPRTPHYHHLTYEELHYRTYSVYRNLGHWLSYKSEEPIEANYTDLARRRFAEGIPLEEVVFALISTKNHLDNYVRSVGLMDSAVELHQERELTRLVGSFFDKAIYYTVRAYAHQQASAHARGAMKAAV